MFCDLEVCCTGLPLTEPQNHWFEAQRAALEALEPGSCLRVRLQGLVSSDIIAQLLCLRRACEAQKVTMHLLLTERRCLVLLEQLGIGRHLQASIAIPE